MISFHSNTYEQLLQNKQIFNQDLNGCDSNKTIKDWFLMHSNIENFFLTKSCTQSLELAIVLLDLPKESEVIMPSYSFVSLANAVNNFGHKCVFVDCEKNTMNIDSNCIESAITSKTKAIITINYGGIACDYDSIRSLCKKYDLFLIEDNAHGIKGMYKNEILGTIGDISCFSFDHMKNFTAYQGGGIAINNKIFLDQFFILSEFGTNRKLKLQGDIDFYEWIGKGTNSILAEPLAKILWHQLKHFDFIQDYFNNLWNFYYKSLIHLENEEFIILPIIPDYCSHNAHMFWFKTKSKKDRVLLIEFLKKNGILAQSHYFPLHNSKYGSINSRFIGEDLNTTNESDKLLRFPLHLGINESIILKIAKVISEFFNK